jgi:hypothetical protein
MKFGTLWAALNFSPPCSKGEYAEQIVRSVRLLNHSVTNVLHFGRPIAPSPKQISVNTLLEGIRSLIQPLAAKKTRLELNAISIAP